MDLVVRTSHGEAEISLPLDDSSIGDVVEQVTGRPAPPTLYVDGRAMPSSAPLDGCELLAGSVVATDDDDGEPEPSSPSVLLEQVAGPAAGSTAWLRPGRHVIGPGRRVSTAELGRAPVDEPMFELDVAADGTVEVTARHRHIRLDGEPLDDREAVPWRDEILDVGGRAFRLGRDDPAGPRHAAAGRGGTVTFNRPPRPTPATTPEPPEMPRRVPRPFRQGSDRARTQLDEILAAHLATERRRRRSAQPDPVVATRHARRTDARLWERRPVDADAFQIAVGLADLQWTPQLAPASAGPVVRHLETHALLPMVPVVVDLGHERAVGVAGSDDFTAGVARSLVVLAATTHGPADLEVVVLTGPDRAHAWEWVKWLPHNRPEGTPQLLVTEDQVDRWVSRMSDAGRIPERATADRADRLTLVVIDESAWWRDRTSPLRPLFAEHSSPLRFVTLVGSADDVPSVCTTVISQQADDLAVVARPVSRKQTEDVFPYMLAPRLALEAARALAPLDDPEMPLFDEAPVPPAVALLDLVEMPAPTPSQVAERWAGSAGRPVARLGTAEAGPVTVDLIGDGPHMIVAGVATSTRQELIDTMVVSMAAELAPRDLDLVLVDRADGSDVLGRLPHTVSRLTDLDAHGVARVVRSLDAEVRHRERVADGSDPDDSARPPRLLVVVDDLDDLDGRLPGTASSISDLARRGTDVGVHFLVAVRDAVHDAGATVVVQVPSRDDGLDGSLAPDGGSDPGRTSPLVPAVARIGGRTPHPFRPADNHARRRLGIRPFVVARDLVPMEQRLERAGGSAGTDIDRLVDAIGAAADGFAPVTPRHPVADPLPDHLPMRSFFDRHPGDGVPFALADLPDEQERAPAWWSPGEPTDPGTAGTSRLAIGEAGSGTTSLLITLVLGTAERFSADDVHVYAIRADTDPLDALEALPHVGAVVRGDDVEGVARLLHLLTTELGRRAADTDPAAAPPPTIVVAVDDIGALRRRLDRRRDLETVWPQLETIVRDGPAVGFTVLITADRHGDVPAELASEIPHPLVLDFSAAADAGLAAVDTPHFVPGRAVRTSDRVELQLAEPPASLDEAVAAVGAEPALERPPAALDPLPGSVAVGDLVGHAEATDRGVLVPVGLHRGTAGPAWLHVVFGEHVFVTGPAGSGRSSVLASVADAVRRAAPTATVFAAAVHGGPLADVGDDVDTVRQRTDTAAWVDRVLATTGPRVVLVDDADRLDGPEFERLGTVRDGDVSVVVAGVNADLRTVDHWSRPLQRFRRGVLLEPAPSDGDLLRVALGARLPRVTAGNGVLVDDGAIAPLLAAVAVPAPDTEAG